MKKEKKGNPLSLCVSFIIFTAHWGRGLKAIHRELWSLTCPEGHQSHQCPQQGGQDWSSSVGIWLRTSLPERCLLNSRGGKCALVAFSLHGTVTNPPQLWILSGAQITFGAGRFGSVSFQKLTLFLCFCKCSPILVSPLCRQVVSGGSKWDFYWWVLYPPLAGAGKCANPCKYQWG